MIRKVALGNLCAIYILIIVLTFTGNVQGDGANESDSTGDVERLDFKYRGVSDYDYSFNKVSGHSDIDITGAESEESGNNVIFTLRVRGDIIENSYNDTTIYYYCIGVMLDDWRWISEYSDHGGYEYEAHALYFMYYCGHPMGIYYDGVVSAYNLENMHFLTEGYNFTVSTYGNEISFTLSKDSFSYGQKWDIYGFAWEFELPEYEDYENSGQYNFDFTYYLDYVGTGGEDCPFSPVAQYKQLSSPSSPSSDKGGEGTSALTYGAIAGGAVVTAAVAIVVIKALAGGAVAAKGGVKAGAKAATKLSGRYGAQSTHGGTLGHQAPHYAPRGIEAGQGHISPQGHGDIALHGRQGYSPPHGHLPTQPIPPLNPAQIGEIGRNLSTYISDMLWKCLKQAFTDYIHDEIRSKVLDQLSKRIKTIRDNRDLIGAADEMYFIINEILLANNIRQATISACSLSARMIADNLREIIERETKRTKGTKKPSACSVCGEELHYVDKYDRWWCDRCEQYDRKGAPGPTKADKDKCSACGHDLVYVDKYDRWWCDRCEQYDRKGASEPTKADKDKCFACGYDLVYVDKYDRWWCDRCREYDQERSSSDERPTFENADKKKRKHHSDGFDEDPFDLEEIDAAISELEAYDVDFDDILSNGQISTKS